MQTSKKPDTLYEYKMLQFSSHSAEHFKIKLENLLPKNWRDHSLRLSNLSPTYPQCLGWKWILPRSPLLNGGFTEAAAWLLMHSEFTHVTVASWRKTCVKCFTLETGIKCQHTKWGNNNKVGGHQGKILCWISQQQAARAESNIKSDSIKIWKKISTVLYKAY